MSAEQSDATHVFCQLCDSIQPAIFERLDAESTDGRFLGGDIVCARCHLVITTLYKELK